MRLLHKLAFALSVVTFALLVAAMATIWYGTDISGHIGDASGSVNIHLTLWELKSKAGDSSSSKNWRDVLYNDDIRDEKFCPDGGDDGPSNADAYHTVATSAATATLAMALGFAFVLVGFAYGVAKIHHRAAVAVLGSLAAVCACIAFATWIRFIEMCDHKCEQFDVGGSFAGADKSCSYGIGFVFEIISCAGLLVSMIMYVAATPAAEGEAWYQRMK